MQDQFSLTSLKLLFYRYKDTPYYPMVNVAILFGISVFLLIQVVLPQLSTWFSVQHEVESLRATIATMEQNKTFLTSLNKQSVQDDVDLVTQAYPFSIDYAGIIAGLSEAAAKANVPLSDFSVAVGDTNQSFPSGVPAMYPFTFTFPTDLNGAERFIDQLEQVLPIASVTSISNSGATTTVALQFYYHGYPQITIDAKEPLKPLSPAESSLLAKLQGWRVQPSSTQVNEEPSDLTVTGSTSASFPPPL